MSNEILFTHFVCTHKEATEIIHQHSEYWVSNCGCRESNSNCAQSKSDVCLFFYDDVVPSGSGKKQISAEQVKEILRAAKSSFLVARPYRNDALTRVDGICFCCNDCCSYFTDDSEQCNKGIFIEKTDMENCINCSSCVDVCYFNARKMENNVLKLTPENCYGCGLCIDMCPEFCIKMVPTNFV